MIFLNEHLYVALSGYIVPSDPTIICTNHKTNKKLVLHKAFPVNIVELLIIAKTLPPKKQPMFASFCPWIFLSQMWKTKPFLFSSVDHHHERIIVFSCVFLLWYIFFYKPLHYLPASAWNKVGSFYFCFPFFFGISLWWTNFYRYSGKKNLVVLYPIPLFTKHKCIYKPHCIYVCTSLRTTISVRSRVQAWLLMCCCCCLVVGR